MLTEIAPRVILRLGGNLVKFRFIVVDIHKKTEFNDKEYDVILI